jgi:hypothetical protein
MIWLGDDVGMQEGMLISPPLATLLKRLADLIRAVKVVNPRLQVTYHSDGDISPIIPELIEIG